MKIPVTLYAASELSRAIPGWSKRRVIKALSGVKPAGSTVVGGNVADGWAAQQLPSALLNVLEARRLREGLGTLADVLGSSCRRWEPPVPLARADAPSVTTAKKLQRALGAGLKMPAGTSLAERARLTVEDYKEQFGRNPTPRWLCALIGRTLARDGGAGNWERLELYLPDSAKPRRRRAGAPAVPSDFPELDDALGAVADFAKPSPTETASFWRAVVDCYAERLASGEQRPRPLKRALRAFLRRNAPFAARSATALTRNLDRKLASAARSGVVGLVDGRLSESGRPRQAPEWTENMLLFATRTRALGGRESQAWRELHLGTCGQRFTESFRAYFPFNVRRAKSRVPGACRDAVRPMMAATDAPHLGPKAARLAAPSYRRDWSDTLAGDWYQGDDETPNHYWWEEFEHGEYEYEGMRFDVCRGQHLPMCDLRTDLPLAFVLLPGKHYNSWVIRTLTARTMGDPRVGLPFRGVYYEKGIWAARNVDAQFAWADIDEAFARRGIRLQVRHATTPRAKIIERVFAATQNMMEDWPGYAGRDERNVHHERVRNNLARLKRVGQPRKAEVHPGKFFLSKDQTVDRLHDLYLRFAAEPQNGERLDGLSPAEGWRQLSGGRPHVVLPESLRFLLSTCFSEQTVTGDGVKLKIGGLDHFYFGSEQLGELVGEKVKVGFDPELPEQVAVIHPGSDPRGTNPFAVPLFKRLPATTATVEDFAQAREHRNAFTAFGRSVYRLIAPRSNLTVSHADAGTADLRERGARINALQSEHVERGDRRRRHAREIKQLASEQNLNIDPAQTRDPQGVLSNLERARELAQKLRRVEAAGRDETNPPGHDRPAPQEPQ